MKRILAALAIGLAAPAALAQQPPTRRTRSCSTPRTAA